MDVATPFITLFPALPSTVLAILARANRPRTGREIARVAERSPAGVRTVLQHLVEQGLVDRQPAGKAYVYSLNRDHVATPAIESLVNLRHGLIERLRDRIATWETEPVHASLFGSAARGDGDASSDIDLLVLRSAGIDEDDEPWRSQVDGLAESVVRWTGNHAGIVELSANQITSLKKRRPPILKDLDSDAVTLAGPDIGTIVRGEAVAAQ